MDDCVRVEMEGSFLRTREQFTTGGVGAIGKYFYECRYRPLECGQCVTLWGDDEGGVVLDRGGDKSLADVLLC